MTDRDTTNNGNKDESDRNDTPEKQGVPGAHGKEDMPPKGKSGVSNIRSDTDEIQPSEDVGDA